MVGFGADSDAYITSINSSIVKTSYNSCFLRVPLMRKMNTQGPTKYQV